ncbi:YeeE/YedE family protein [Parasalinivibrio latis]|uniref:YeeE/YedE family protein n=1 Tax=Parasalinivibrio latis TaxID=2952610 RepID=UPI0030E42292
MNEYISALFGGAMVGGAAALLLFVNGRIAGISGIAAGIMKTVQQDVLWRVLFILGMMSAGFVFQDRIGALTGHFSPSFWILVIAGLLVGLGASLANGCTSGHGICGIGRFSVRSLVATVTFMFTAGVTVFFLRHGGLFL